VVKTRRAALEKRRHDHAFCFCGKFAVELGCLAGYGYGEAALLDIFCLAEIKGVVKFLVYYQPGATGSEASCL